MRSSISRGSSTGRPLPLNSSEVTYVNSITIDSPSRRAQSARAKDESSAFGNPHLNGGGTFSQLRKARPMSTSTGPSDSPRESNSPRRPSSASPRTARKIRYHVQAGKHEWRWKCCAPATEKGDDINLDVKNICQAPLSSSPQGPSPSRPAKGGKSSRVTLNHSTRLPDTATMNGPEKEIRLLRDRIAAMASEELSGSDLLPGQDSNLFRHAREHYELKKKVEELNRQIYNFKNESGAKHSPSGEPKSVSGEQTTLSPPIVAVTHPVGAVRTSAAEAEVEVTKETLVLTIKVLQSRLAPEMREVTQAHLDNIK